MCENSLAKMSGARKKILSEVLCNARDLRAFNSIFGG